MIKNNLLIYLIIILFIMLSFGAGYYINNVSNQKITIEGPVEQPVEQPAQRPTGQPTSESLIQLQDGADEHRLDGSIISIDTTKNPAEITFTVLWNSAKFISALPNNLQRTVRVAPDAFFWQGPFMSMELESIKITDLKPGDNIIIITADPIFDLLTREAHTATIIRRVIKN